MAGGGLIIIELFLHRIIGSDLSGFTRYKKADEKNTDVKESEEKTATQTGYGNADVKEENKITIKQKWEKLIEKWEKRMGELGRNNKCSLIVGILLIVGGIALFFGKVHYGLTLQPNIS